jgi:hypothetical protein
VKSNGAGPRQRSEISSLMTDMGQKQTFSQCPRRRQLFLEAAVRGYPRNAGATRLSGRPVGFSARVMQVATMPAKTHGRPRKKQRQRGRRACSTAGRCEVGAVVIALQATLSRLVGYCGKARVVTLDHSPAASEKCCRGHDLAAAYDPKAIFAGALACSFYALQR